MSCALRKVLIVSIFAFARLEPAFAQAEKAGLVELPLAVYNQLVESSRSPEALPRPAPAGFALGSAQVGVTVEDDGTRASGLVRVDLKIRVLEDEWTAVPVLPVGTAVDSVTVGGAARQLLPTPAGLVWSTQKAGTYDMALVYRVDVSRSDQGRSLPVPVPQAAATTLNAILPGTGLDVAVIPSAGARSTPIGASTRVQATVPTTNGVQISWRTPAKEGHALSRAIYTGELTGEAVRFTGELQVDLWSDETLTLPLVPSTVTLNQLRLDGEDAAILVEADAFATLIRGRGSHTLEVGFEVPISRRDGPPAIELAVPQVPVSRFELTLPGQKEVTVTPASNVTTEARDGATVATAHVPLTRRVAISWAEAVPEEVGTEVRANAGLYHSAYAEEGVLYVRALVDYQVSRGETNILRFAVPGEAQVNRIASPSGAVADWRLQNEDGEDGNAREVTVFLDRQLSGQLFLDIAYDRSLGSQSAGAEVVVPFLRALDAQRQRGMVALLSSKDLTLEPSENTTATRVGENQLPAFVRQSLEMSVAHTFKYVEDAPDLVVRPTPPERSQGRFDAQVDTLISLGEVTIRGSASIEIDVKSGAIMELVLELPTGVNLLSLTGPSVRDHALEPFADGQRIAVAFTQEMEGQFRLEAAYERILVDSEAELEVPTLTVAGAEVEQGRIAVEALSAVEVQPAAVEQLTSLDVSELPRQLILRTTNPILMAYKYVHADPPYRLGLTVTRHEVVEVQEAAIDRADYRTLITRDGLAVTRARFEMRNSGKQFLRLRLPEGSEIWSAMVDGRAEKPARTQTESGEVWHLIKIVHSTQGFPVELVFETPAGAIRGLGTVSGVLPRPEILVTRSRWDVHLPADVRYGEPKGGMDVVVAGAPLTPEDVSAEMARLEEEGRAGTLEPLRLRVPTHAAGVHFAFEKLYANQGRGEVGFAIPYASGLGRTLGSFLSFLGALACWLGVGFFVRLQHRLGVGLLLGGGGLLAVMILRYQMEMTPAVGLSVIVLFGVALYFGKGVWERWRGEPEESDAF